MIEYIFLLSFIIGEEPIATQLLDYKQERLLTSKA